MWNQLGQEEVEIVTVVRDLIELIKSGTQAPGRQVIVIEGVSERLSSKADGPLATLVDECRKHNQFVIAESETSTYTQYGDVLKSLKAERSGLLLQPSSEDGDSLLRTSLPRLQRTDFPPGRGFFISAGRYLKVQLARPE